MEFLSVNQNNCEYYFDYENYFKYLIEHKKIFSHDFLDKYIENHYFHDYYTVSLKFDSYEREKNSTQLVLSPNYHLTKTITLKYDSVERIEYFNNCAYLGNFLYSEFSFINNLICHEILFDEGKLDIWFHKIKIQ